MPEQSITIELPEKIDVPPPEGVNFFTFSFMGTDIQLLAGHLDTRLVHLAREKARETGSDTPLRVQPKITHCFLMSPSALFQLKQRVDDIWSKLEAREVEAISSEEDEES